MTTTDKIPSTRRPANLVASIERGLDRIITSPTSRIRTLRQELEAQESERQHRVKVKSKETRETLEMATKYLRSLPNS